MQRLEVSAAVDIYIYISLGVKGLIISQVTSRSVKRTELSLKEGKTNFSILYVWGGGLINPEGRQYRGPCSVLT